jgi:hypothetical protein
VRAASMASRDLHSETSIIVPSRARTMLAGDQLPIPL